MNLGLLILGIILTLFMIPLYGKLVSMNEWHYPLLELACYLGKLPFRPGRKHRAVVLIVFNLFLLLLCEFIILYSVRKTSFRHWVGLALLVLFLWALKGAFGLLRALYSQKVRLLNYLYVPHFFAWRRDLLSEYSDKEVASAVCEACGIADESLRNFEGTLRDFLIALHARTRPSHEQEAYPQLLDSNIKEANLMVRH